MHLHADRGVALASFNELAQTNRTSPLTNRLGNKETQDKEMETQHLPTQIRKNLRGRKQRMHLG